MQNKALTTVNKFDLSAIENANLSESTKAKYTRAISQYLATGNQLGDYQAVQTYAQGLSQSGRAFFKAAIRLVSAEYAQALKAGASPDNIAEVQAGLYRLEALQGAVKTQKTKGSKVHVWLSQKQVSDITAACGDNLEGKRDWIVLGLLLGAGLRREELVTLTFEALKRIPKRKGGMRDVLEITGKGSKTRVVPIKPLLAEKLREWQGIVGGGLIARSLGRGKTLGGSLSAVAVFHLVRKYGAKIGLPDLDPHDLRRTYAQLGYDAGISITQISVLLGHSNVATTQRYLNLELDTEITISDFIPLVGD